MGLGDKINNGLDFYQEIKKFTPVNIKALVQYESSGNPQAVSKKGAVGLTQIKVKKGALDDWNIYHKNEKYTVADLKNPKISLKIGNWYANERIPSMLRFFKIPDNLMTRISSYNWGIGNVRKWYKKGGNFADLPSETQLSIKRYLKYSK